MSGIIAHAAYLPYYRLDRSAIGATLGQPGGRGTRTVASYDEDTTTLAVEAGRRVLRSTEVEPAALTFSTAVPAYADKTNASAIHAALRLPMSAPAFDAVGAARSGVGAVLAAASGGGPTLVTVADIRTGLPGSAEERDGGDAAAAFLVGSDADGPVVAELLGSGSASAEFLDRWRAPGAPASKVWEERFGEHAYLPLVEAALGDALKRAGVEADAVDTTILAGLSGRAVRSSGRALGPLGQKVVDDLSGTVGNTGTAHPWLLLSSVLETAGPGQTIALVVLADGCDVLLFRTTDAIAGYSVDDSVAGQLESGSDGLDYAKFLTWRGFLDREPPRRPDPERPAAPPALRAETWKYGFVGSKDRSSGAIHLPPQRVSMQGGTVDDMVPVPMADVPATIATYTVDRLAFSLSPPVVAAVIDFDGGGRFQCEVTDVDPAAVKIGDRVQMTFRRLFTADGVHNYFWKARPVAS